MMEDKDKDVNQARDSRAEASRTNPTTDGSNHGENPEAKTIWTRLLLRQVSFQSLRDLNIAYEFDPSEPDSVLVKRTMSEEEQDILFQHTGRIREARAVEAERTSRAPPLPSTEVHIEHDDEVVVIEYHPPLEGGIKEITKIPSRLTNAHALESLGWQNFELKDGFFEVRFPLKQSHLNQILSSSKGPQKGEQIQTKEIREEGIRVRGDPPPPLPPRRFVEREYDDRTYPPPRRTASPESLDPRYSRRRSTYRDEPHVYYNDELRYRERNRSYYEGRSRSPSRQRYREPEVEREHYRRRSLSPSVIFEERYEIQERYEPPENGGKSLKFDVNLLSLASDIKDKQATKVHRPTKTPSIDKPETVSIETSQRYTGNSGGETVVLTTGLKVSSSQLGHLRWIHLEHQHMSFESLQQLLLQTENLNNDDVSIARHLVRKFQEDGGEKPYVHGYYLQPDVLRCDSHDVGSGQKPDRACTFVCFPYFSFQNASPPSSKTSAHTHSPRGLLQTLYYLESTKARDLEQVVCKLRPHKGDEMICVSQMWAIVLGSDTLITYSASPLATMRGDKIQITNPASTIRTAPSSLRVTNPFERLFFFSLDQCKTWFELTNLIHDQCLHSYGYSIYECNLYLKNDQKLKAPSWSVAIEAEKSPIVDIFVRFKDARELEEDEDERAETERERRRYRAEDNVDERTF